MNFSSTGVPHVLAYHEIDDQNSGDVYCISPDVFMSHMWAATHQAEQIKQSLHITFDDGHVSHMRWAVPILNELGAQGHFFIPTAWMGSKHGYINWNDVRSIAEQGHRVGSHGATHVFLSVCTPSQLEEEVRNSRLTLEDKIGQAVTSISMPGGRWNEAVIRACAVAGYKEVYTSEPGMYRTAKVENNMQLPAVIGRFAVRRKTSLRTIAAYIEGDFFAISRLRGMYLFRQLAKRMIGDRGYQHIWSSLFRAMPG